MLNKLICVMAAIVVLCSCTDKKQYPDDGVLLLSVPKTSVDYKASQQFIKVTASSSWTLDVEFEGDESGWARVDKSSGSSSVSDIVLDWDENSSTEGRRCTLTLKGTGNPSAVVFAQEAGKPSKEDNLKPDKVPNWLELPSTDRKGRFFFTHDMAHGSARTVRNYSFHLDTAAKVAAWIAYPLNTALIGRGSRTDEWGLDPKVPQEYQPVIYSGFRGGRYDRGHQLPSADRLSHDANVTTFYGTNMTPQRNALNGSAWATLEGKVRDCSKQLDTLYVVTGADLDGVTEYALDNVGKKIAVPTGYYKVLLGYKSGGSIGASTGGYIGIAFYFEHRGYGSNDLKAQSMSIKALEDKLGMDFFVNLPDKIGKDNATLVESQPDSWWYNIFNR